MSLPPSLTITDDSGHAVVYVATDQVVSVVVEAPAPVEPVTTPEVVPPSEQS